jgi:CheY-like chemotaxis protein
MEQWEDSGRAEITATGITVMARILIIDDNQTIRQLMRFYIEHAGYIVCGEADGGVEGIELAKRMQPDLILLDLTMPEMSGTETAAMLKRVLPETPIILFTLHQESINRELAATMGVDMVVDKGEGIPKLGEAVKSLLGRNGKGAAGQDRETSTRSTATKQETN